MTGYAQEAILWLTTEHSNTGYRNRVWEVAMEALATIATILVGLVGLDLIAFRWGSDTRRAGRDADEQWTIR